MEVIVDIAKLRDYCLSDAHPRGRHKARVFRSQLGWTAADAERVRRWLIEQVRLCEASLQATGADQFGTRYVLDLPAPSAAGPTLRTAWIVRPGEAMLIFTTCYLL